MADLTIPETARTIRVLHVDDDASLLEISRLILKDQYSCFEIDHACCVDEGLTKLATGNYDIVISDYEMPQKDGLQFLSELRKQKNEIPFILFTGKGREEVAIKALNLGADGYHNKQGSPETVYGELSHDIRIVVEHYKAKQKLIKSETKYSYLFSNMLNGFAHCKMIFDKEGKSVDWVYLEVNDAFTKLTGLEREAVIGKKVTKAILGIEKSNPELFEIYGRVALTGKHEQFDILFAPMKIWLSVSAYSPEKGSFIALFENISDRKNAEEKLKSTFGVLERVGENIDAGLAVIGKDYRVVWANKRLMALGVAPNKKCYQTFNFTETICPDCGAKKIFEQNIALDVHEYKTLNSKGETIWIELRVTPLKDKNGNVMAALELAVPITERKKSQEKLEKERSEFRNILDYAPVMIAYKSKDDHFVRVNSAFADFAGLPKEKIVGMTTFDLVKEQEVAQQGRDHDLQVMRTGMPVLNQIVKWSGLRSQKEIWALYSKLPFHDSEGNVIGTVSYILDVDERKKAEAALLLSEEKFRNIFAIAPNAVYLCTLKEGRFIEVNDRFEEMFGYKRKEIIGQTSLQLGLLANPSDRLRMLAILELEGKARNLEIDCVRKNGQVFPTEFSVSLLDQGNQQLLVGVIRDFSSHKQSEESLKLAAKELQMLNEKLRVVGSLTRHDVGNKLAAIAGSEYLLRKLIGGKPEFVKYLDNIKNAIDASHKLFEFSHYYEKIGAEKTAVMEVFECFNMAAALFSNLTELKIVNDCQGLKVLADSLLRQLFYNLIDNSLTHGEKVTQIRLHFSKGVDEVKLFYEDNGVGIPQANKSRLFEVGFTTGKGSGLGLALIKRMVEVYGWSIVEEGEEGRGAKFKITIPNHAQIGEGTA